MDIEKWNYTKIDMIHQEIHEKAELNEIEFPIVSCFITPIPEHFLKNP